MVFGISQWDWFTLLLYYVGVTFLGVWTLRKVKDTTDFFIGGRRFGELLMVFFSFGAGTNGNQAVGHVVAIPVACCDRVPPPFVLLLVFIQQMLVV